MNDDHAISERLVDAVKKFEGYKTYAYQDSAGIWTIGYGRTGRIHEGDTTTHAFEDRWLRNRLEEIGKDIKRRVVVPIKQNQFEALASFIYNVGYGAFHRSTLLKRINQGDSDPGEEFERWIHAGGRVLAGLVRRRKHEREWFSEHLA